MSIVEFLSQPLWQRLGLTLVHFLWQGLAIAVLAGASVRVFRLNHGNTRYAAYLLAFAVMIICPIVTFTAIDIPTIPVVEFVREAEFPHVVESVSYTVLPAGDILPEAETSSPVIPTLADSIPLGQRISDWLNVSMPWVLVIWMAGVVVLSVRLVMGFVGVYRWRHHLQPLPERLGQRVGSLSERLGMRRFSRVFISPTVLQAMAVGYLRPMVLLPAAMVARMQPEMLEAVIAHELAHIRRLDLWVNLAQRVTETLLFYHPAVWWLSNCLRSERELCCDELAVKATGERITYASTLESVGRARFMTKPPVLAAGLGQDNKPTLSRVRHILGLKPTQRNCPFWLAGVIAVLFLAALVIPTTLALTNQSDEKLKDLESVVVEGIRANRAKFECGYLAWNSKHITTVYAAPGQPPVELEGEYEFWWDGEKIASKYLLDQVYNDPNGNFSFGKQQGSDSYDGGGGTKKPRFGGDQNWLGPQITRWRGTGSQDWLLEQDSKQEGISRDWSVVEINGAKVLRYTVKNMNDTNRDYGGYSIRDYDPSKGYGLVNEEWYNPNGSPRLKHTVTMLEVIPGGWFPVEIDFKSFAITDGKVYSHNHFALHIERCRFNDRSAFPARVFKGAIDKQVEYQEKLQKYLEMELRGISDVQEAGEGERVKGTAREAVETFIAAAMAGDFEKAGQFTDPNRAVADQMTDIPELLKGQKPWIMAVLADDFDAIAVSSVILGDHERIGPLLFFLHRDPQDGRDNWLVHDIDMETPDSAEVELKRFLEKHPDAQKVSYEHKSAVQVEGEDDKISFLEGISGKPAPELQQIKGWKNSRPITLADQRGKFVLLDFWGYWCVPCLRDIPHLMAINEAFSDRGLMVIGVHDDSVESINEMDAKLAKAREMIWKGRDLNFPIALDGGGETKINGTDQTVRGATTAAYGITGFPTTILIGRDGKVIGEFHAPSLDEKLEKLEKLLGVQAKTPEWKVRFNEVYRLDDGELLRHIPEPYIPERNDFFFRQFSRWGWFQAMPWPHMPLIPESSVLTWDEKKNQATGGMDFDQKELIELLRNFGFDESEFDGDPAVLEQRILGDWIKRDTAKREDLLKAFENILNSKLNLSISFAPQEAERDVFVARGTFKFHPIKAEYRNNEIQLFVEKPDPPDNIDGGGGSGSLDSFLANVGQLRKTWVINETETDTVGKLVWRQHSSTWGGRWQKDHALFEKLLENIEKQTSLRFYKDRRKRKIWLVKDSDGLKGAKSAKADAKVVNEGQSNKSVLPAHGKDLGQEVEGENKLDVEVEKPNLNELGPNEGYFQLDTNIPVRLELGRVRDYVLVTAKHIRFERKGAELHAVLTLDEHKGGMLTWNTILTLLDAKNKILAQESYRDNTEHYRDPPALQERTLSRPLVFAWETVSKAEIFRIEFEQLKPIQDPLGRVPGEFEKYIEGTVTDSHGKPVKDAFVTICEQKERGGYRVPQVITDSQGHYQLGEVPWPYKVSASRVMPSQPDGIRRTQLIELPQVHHEVERIDMQFDPFPEGQSALIVKAQNQFGQPFTNYHIMFFDYVDYENPPEGRFFTKNYRKDVTDPAGSITFSKLPAGDYRIWLIPKDRQYQTPDVRVTIGDNQRQEETITIPSKLKLYGRILFEDGSPAVIHTPEGRVAKAEISYRRGKEEKMASGKGEVDENGYFEIHLTEDEYEALQNDHATLHIHIRDLEEEGSLKSLGVFPVEKLSKNRESAGTFIVEKPDVQVDAKTAESAEKLKKLNTAILMYADDHDDKYPDDILALYSFLDAEDLNWLLIHVKYLGKGKTSDDVPAIPLAYDSTPAEDKPTNVLFNNNRVELVAPERLKKLGINRAEIQIETRYVIGGKTFIEEVGFDANSIYDANALPGFSIEISPPSDGSQIRALILDQIQVEFLLRAVQAEEDAKTLTAPRVTVLDGESAEFSIQNAVQYVGGYSEPNGPAENPVAKQDSVEPGSFLWVKPKLSLDDKYIDLDFEYEFRQLLGFEERMYRGKYPYKIPQIELVTTKVHCPLPNGRTLLISGQKITGEENGQKVKGMLILLLKAEKATPEN